jgi:autotransporter-associated beta strand protein
MGPLADLYRTGAQAVTGITTAPETTPPTPVSDTLPADAPPGSALGAGSTSSALGLVAQLVNTVRGPFASSNPSKLAYQYPRPWRLTEDSEVVDTGATDALGYPVYESDVVVVTQLLRQRSTNPAEDGGYPSGHANAFHLACLAYAYAVPERFQELVACAFDLSDTRIVAGMHSPVDVVSGRILATALAAAALADPQNATLKTAARAQAAEYFQTQTGTTADTLYAYAHSAGVDTDPYADRAANARAVAERLTYGLPGQVRPAPMTVPKGAEVLLETRLPYLDAAQRREVLRTTALPAGHPLLDGTELWGRLNLFAAADGYGAFDDDVLVSLDAAAGGFGAADSWRNDITGRGGLTKLGTGALTLSGANRYRGGTTVRAGTLTAAGPDALGAGDVEVAGGTLRLAAACAVTVRGAYRQSAGVLAVQGGHDRGPALTIEGTATLGRGSVLELRLDAARPGQVVPVLRARRLTGRFGSVVVDLAGYRAVAVYTARGVSVRLIAD